MDRPLILVVSNYYLPARHGGGGTGTVVNTIDRLSDEFRFRVITRGHDAGSKHTLFQDVTFDKWNDVGRAEAWYLKRTAEIKKVLPEIMRTLSPSLVYLNSFFSGLTIRAMFLRRLGALPDVPFLLAPCGELSPGAMSVRTRKKKVFLGAAGAGHLYENITWKASSRAEVDEIQSYKFRGADIRVAPDIPSLELGAPLKSGDYPAKKGRPLRLVCLSRIDRKKNLKWLFENVSLEVGRVELDVYGDSHDSKYLGELTRAVENGSHGIKTRFGGPVPHHGVQDLLSAYDFFVLPTLGENFGHIFLEAMAAGCPVITSDRTPWSDLSQRNAGWTLSLENPGDWQDVLNRCVAMSDDEYRSMSAAARAYAVEFVSDPANEEATRELFRYAISKRGEKGLHRADVGS